MTHSVCARLRRAYRVRRFDEKGPARTLNRLGISSTRIARKPTFDRLAQSLSNELRYASFQDAGFLPWRSRWPLDRYVTRAGCADGAPAPALLGRPRRGGWTALPSRHGRARRNPSPSAALQGPGLSRCCSPNATASNNSPQSKGASGPPAPLWSHFAAHPPLRGRGVDFGKCGGRDGA